MESVAKEIFVSNNKNGAQIAQEFVDKAKSWIATNPDVPLKSDGSVNVTELANIFGIDRKRFSTNEKLRDVINKYLGDKQCSKIGESPISKSVEDKSISELKKENKRLSERIVVMQSSLRDVSKKNDELNKENESLRIRLESQSFNSQMLLEYGRLPR